MHTITNHNQREQQITMNKPQQNHHLQKDISIGHEDLKYILQAKIAP